MPRINLVLDVPGEYDAILKMREVRLASGLRKLVEDIVAECTDAVPWTPFELIPTDEAHVSLLGECYLNSVYQVHKRTIEANDNGFGVDITHLSIRPNDRSVLRDWRHYQRIKNDLCGEDCEGVEIYPAETRLVDNADQFHLWCFPPGYIVPCGFMTRLVDFKDPILSPHASQRPFIGSDFIAKIREATE